MPHRSLLFQQSYRGAVYHSSPPWSTYDDQLSDIYRINLCILLCPHLTLPTSQAAFRRRPPSSGVAAVCDSVLWKGSTCLYANTQRYLHLCKCYTLTLPWCPGEMFPQTLHVHEQQTPKVKRQDGFLLSSSKTHLVKAAHPHYLTFLCCVVSSQPESADLKGCN